MQKKFSHLRSAFLAFSLACLTQLVACSPFSAPDHSAGLMSLPAAYSLHDGISKPPQRWWLSFDEPQLTAFVEEALTSNQNLHASWARVERARGLARKAGSEDFPVLSADTGASYTKTRINDGATGSTKEVQSYDVGVLASYEVDLWGRVRAATASAEFAAAASLEDLNAAAMTIAAEVANRWIGILAAEREQHLLQLQLQTNRTYLELVELRFQKSLASALDVMQQRQLVERVRARIPLAQMQARLLRNELAVLLGRMPGELPEIVTEKLPGLTDIPAAGVPARLLENRPDIRAALSRLEAAEQNLIVARADRLPALRLTGRAAYDSDTVERLFDNWLLNLAAGLTAPLLDGGRRKAEVEATGAAVREQLALYRQTVLNAVREVEEALVREVKIREYIDRTEDQLRAAKSALAEAGARYQNGLNDYLPVLTQLLSVQNLEIDLITRKEDLFLTRINLYRSLGGSWTAELQGPAADIQVQQEGKS